MDTLPAPSPAVTAVRAHFAGGRDYLSACTLGLPSRATRRAVVADVEAAAAGRPPAASYTGVVERTRAHFAALVHADVDDVAIGSQASVFAGVVAAAAPDGAEILGVEGDFSSVLLPFAVHHDRGVRVRTVPADAVADAIRPDTWLVAFSIVQSATGEVADVPAIRAAAERHGTLLLTDATQAVGWLPVDARGFDMTICHTYKWLCAPRGVAFAAISPRLSLGMRPLLAGWYAGDDPWASCYGHDIDLARTARRFDVSPAWQAFVGAEPALALFANSDLDAIHDHGTRLATRFRDALDLPRPAIPSAIVAWEDPDGTQLARLAAAGIVASGRAGRARVAFHVFNDDEDVDRAIAALGR